MRTVVRSFRSPGRSSILARRGSFLGKLESYAVPKASATEGPATGVEDGDERDVSGRSGSTGLEDEEGENLAEDPTVSYYKNLKPRDIVKELDRHIVGHADAKKTVALALRSRWRRKRLTDSMKKEVIPKNILMIGPTGCGKTEIARRMAKFVDAPFIKVEATKYTEVGFKGKDVDTIIQDLTLSAVAQLKKKRKQQLIRSIQHKVDNKLLDALLGPRSKETAGMRAAFYKYLVQGALNDLTIFVETLVPQAPMNPKLAERLEGLGVTSPPQPQILTRRELPIKDARVIMADVAAEKLVKKKDLAKEALQLVQEEGIVFIDEIDKICSPKFSHKSDASDEGVQRDLLPIIEGSVVKTKFGDVDTSYILFIASGAFHNVKPSDMLAELQGRLPVRIEMKGLTEKDLYRILTEPENNLIQQQKLLLGVEGVKLTFTEEAISDIAKMAYEINTNVENLGARRLHTVIEKVMEESSFDAGDKGLTEIVIDKDTVHKKLEKWKKSTDWQKYVL